MKPDWKDAPEWAQWLAADWDGEWRWHESKPHFHMAGVWMYGGRTEMAAQPLDAEKTLEGRP